MNYLLKSSITVLLISFNSLFGMHPDEAIAKNPELKGLIESVKQRSSIIDKIKGVVVQAVDPSDSLLEMAKSVVQKCGIKDDVIVLELKKVIDCPSSYEMIPRTGKWHYADQTTSHRFLILSRDGCESAAECEAWIYHECGHIVYNHGGTFDLVFTKALEHANFALSAVGYLSLVSGFTPSDYKKYFAAGLWLSIMKNFSDIFAEKFLLRFYSRYLERCVDIFAYDHLLQEKKYASFIAYLKYFLDMHEGGKKNNTYGWSCTHPSDYERAKIGLHRLKKYNLKLQDLLNDGQVIQLFGHTALENLLKQAKNLFPKLA